MNLRTQAKERELQSPRAPGAAFSQTDDFNRRGTVRRGAVAELSEIVETPTLYGIVDDSAAVVVTGSNSRDVGGESLNLNGTHAAHGSAVTELTLVIPAPALHTIVDDSTGVFRSGGDGTDPCRETLNLHGRKAGRSSVAELT